MDTIFTSSDSYPVMRSITWEGIDEDIASELTNIVGKTPYERLRDFFLAKEQEGANRKDDQFLDDLAVVLHEQSVAVAYLQSIAAGHFPSTADNPQYAGGVVSEGNRLFTPQEGAQHALNSIRDER